MNDSAWQVNAEWLRYPRHKKRTWTTRPRHQMAASELMEVPSVNSALKAATRIMMQIIAYSGWMLSITILATILPICVA